MRKSIGLTVIFLSLVMVACTPAQHSLVESETVKVETVGYASIKTQVLDKYCLKCHSGKEKPNLTSYENLRNNISAIRFTIFETTDPKLAMPQEQTMSPQALAYMRAWLSVGAPREETFIGDTEPINRDPVVDFDVTFEQVSRHVFDKSCNRCHSKDNAAGITDYTDVEVVRSVFTAIQELSMKPNVNVMPPRNKPPEGADENWLEEEYNRELEELTPNPNRITSFQKDLLFRWYLNGLKE